MNVFQPWADLRLPKIPAEYTACFKFLIYIKVTGGLYTKIFNKTRLCICVNIHKDKIKIKYKDKFKINCNNLKNNETDRYNSNSK